MCLEFSHYTEVFSVICKFHKHHMEESAKAEFWLKIFLCENVSTSVLMFIYPQITRFISHNIQSICGNEIPIFALVGFLLAGATVYVMEKLVRYFLITVIDRFTLNFKKKNF